jgi:hypothetical protein
MFSTNDVNRTPVPSKFQPSFVPKQDVVFQPKPIGGPYINYVAVIESEEVVHSDSDSDSDNEYEPQYKQLYNDREVYSTATLAETPTPTPDPFSLGKDPVKTFYIGSITIVGLYILYKILNKP